MVARGEDYCSSTDLGTFSEAMSRKRRSTDSLESTNACSDLTLRQEEALCDQKQHKCAKLVSLSSTTWQDLPTELLEDILIKAVLMEVNEMKLAKSVWKEKADLVMARLASVCWRWTGILTTNYFESKVHGILDGIAQNPFLLEFWLPALLKIPIYGVTSLKDEVFLIWSDDYDQFSMHVYGRNNMEVEKSVIPLPEGTPISLAACNASDCLYLLHQKQCYQLSVFRISKDVNLQFNISEFVGNLYLSSPILAVTITGELLLSSQRGANSAVISRYDSTGLLKHKLRLPPEIYRLRKIIPKSNGHLVLVSRVKDQYDARKLTEIDQRGTILRERLTSDTDGVSLSQSDIYGRILVIEHGSILRQTPDTLVFLDSEFNELDLDDPQVVEYELGDADVMHYSSQGKKAVRFIDDSDRIVAFQNGYLSFFRITDQ